MRSAGLLVFWVVLCVGVGSAGAVFEPGAWYAALKKPEWTPPGWVFGPVWTLLYVLMGVAAWRVSLAGAFRRRRLPVTVFVLQLVANGLWSWLFFGLQRPGLALLDIAVLWVLLCVCTAIFWGTRREAGLLMLPYLAWVSFAVALNFEIWRLNG